MWETFGRPDEKIYQLNIAMATNYIRRFLTSIEIGKTFDRTLQNKLKDNIKNIVSDFLESLVSRKGLSDFRILNINIELEDIIVKLYIDFGYSSSVISSWIPYTSTNYGLK